MKKLKPAALILLLFSMLLIPVVKAPVLEGWKYSKILEFDDGWEGLQVNFNVTYGAASDGVNFNSQVDFDDLRFYDLYTGVLLPAWNETTVPGEYVEVWLKLDESLSVIMYYGEDSAEPYWNQAAVFVDVISGVVLGLPMNEGSGDTVTDYSGNGNDGTVYGASWVDGKYGKALEFDGTDHVSIAPFLNGETAFSFSAWVKPEASQVDYARIFDLGWYTNGLMLIAHLTTNRFGMFRSDSVNSQAAIYSPVLTFDGNTWYHVVGVWESGSKFRVYVNGIEYDHDAGAGTFTLQNDVLYIGHSSIQMHGVIDEVHVYNRALNDPEIENDYNNYGDVTLEEGSCLVRVWVDIMPSISFGEEVSRDYASRGEFLAAALIASIICVPLLLLVIWGVKKRS